MITQLLGAPWGRAVDFPLKGTGEQGRESQGLGDRAGAVPIGRCGWGIRQNGRVIEIDSRPSDAIALGIATVVPIFVAEHVLEEVSR